MAMTKAEKQVVNDLLVRAALNWPENVQPIDLAVLFEGWQAGRRQPVALWTYNACAEGRVTRGWTDGHIHSNEGRCPAPGERPDRASQTGGGPWFHTQLEAAKACRYAMTQEVAKRLAAMDARIDEIKSDAARTNAPARERGVRV